MDSWLLMRNDLIEQIEKRSDYQLPMPKMLKNSLKTVVKLTNAQSENGSTLYSKKFSYKIPKIHDFMSQMYMKVQMETGAVTTVETNVGCRVFKRITFQTMNGVVLQTILPRYTSARIDELNGTGVHDLITAGLNTSGSLTSGQIYLMVPLFLFFSESTASFMRTRPLEQLQIVFEVADTKEDLGISVDITSASYELYVKYFDTNDANKFINQIYYEKNSHLIQKMPKYIVNSYDIFEEDPLTVVSGSTTKRMYLRCPHPTFAMHISLVASDQTVTQINNVKINIKGVEFIDQDYRCNYDLSVIDKASFEPSGTYTLYFDKLKNRIQPSGLIVFSDNMFPSELIVDFDSLGADHTLRVICEYKTNFSVSEKGEIRISDDHEGSLMDQMNIDNTATLE